MEAGALTTERSHRSGDSPPRLVAPHGDPAPARGTVPMPEQTHDLRSNIGPYAMVPAWLLTAPISDRAVRLYGILARRANNDTGRCWPGRQRLANDCGGCSLDSIDRAMTELVELGAVTRQRQSVGPKGRAPNIYTVQFAPPPALVALLNTPDIEEVDREPAANPDEVGRSGAATVSREAAALSRPSDLDPENARADAPASPRPRPRDEVWDALVAVWGEPATDPERKARGKVVRQLKAEHLTNPAALVDRGRRARQRWSEATPNVLVTRWTDLDAPATTSVHEQASQHARGGGVR